MIFRWSEGKKYLHGFVAQSRSVSFPKSYCSSLLYVGCNICSSQGQWHLLTGVSLPYYHLLLNSVTLQALFLFLLAWMVFSLILLSSSSFTLASHWLQVALLIPSGQALLSFFALALTALSVAFYINMLYSIILYLTSHPGSELFLNPVYDVESYIIVD